MKLTPAQQYVIDRIAKGNRLVRDGFHAPYFYFFVASNRKEGDVQVTSTCINALLEKKLLQLGEQTGYTCVITLTDRGRE